MIFKVGQKVCLWDVKSEMAEGRKIVLNEVIVEIMDTKTGVPGLPKNYQSLRAMDKDGMMYEKHWKNFSGVEIKLEERLHWSPCYAAGKTDSKWIPYEAVSVYNLTPTDRVKIVDLEGKKIEPKEATFCKVHKKYSFIGEKCLYCPIEKKK